MPISRVRTPKPRPLRGLPLAVLRLAPDDLPPALKGRWCRDLIAGLVGDPMAFKPRSQLSESVRRNAHRRGQAIARRDPVLVKTAQAYLAQQHRDPRRPLRLAYVDSFDFWLPAFNPHQAAGTSWNHRPR